MRGLAGRLAGVLVCAAAVASALSAGAVGEDRRVGRQTDGSVVLPTNQELRPAGLHVEFPGRANAVALRPKAHVATVLTDQAPALTVVELRTGTIVQRFNPGLGDASFTGVVYSKDGNRLYASMSKGKIAICAVAPDGTLQLLGHVEVGSHPGGLALSTDGRRLYVALSKANELGVVDLASRRLVARIPVGNAPHSVVVAGGHVVVTNRGGRRPRSGDFTNASAGTPIVADAKSGSAATGTVSIVDPFRRRVVAERKVGLHPSNMAVRGHHVFVVNSNNDSVSVLDMRSQRIVAVIPVRPFPYAPFGSSPTSVSVLDATRIVVSLGRNNAVAVIRWTTPGTPSVIEGLVPTGWYPSDVVIDKVSQRMVVANMKGVGALPADDGTGPPLIGIGAGGVNVRATRGSASVVPLPTAQTLLVTTKTVVENNGWHRLESVRRGDPQAPPKPIPDKLGEPSTIKHVFLVIKENRTYDQVMGDDPRGNGDPTKVQFGAAITPNQHALAAHFPLFDNFYVNGTVSADGHHWLVQAFVTDYLEEAFGDWSRSYPYDGGDALAYAPSPFIWEHAQRFGKTVKVYGEFADHVDKQGRTRSDIPSLDRLLVRSYPRFNLNVKDQQRALLFGAELDRQIRTNTVPNLSIIQLPMDHTRGTKPGAMTPTHDMIDHDYAFGKIVEKISHSAIWESSAIFAVEDDAQFGLDHVDGHRAPAWIISPWVRRGHVDNTYYTQIDMLRTIEQILGLPPMNQVDLLGKPMRTAFSDVPITSPYQAIAPDVDLELNPPLEKLDGMARLWAEACDRIDFTRPDAAPEQMLNRAIWYAIKGWVPYPGDDRVLTPAEATALPSGD
ncbi:MAG TPA: bifunctional YncE family protein/alkaline phosphatase family protein [Frankiaceae bacterium]|nr:bifunctional YncE family protein/alkaline phosphatase family protein [Frankiaceae bacterium]